MQNEGTLNGNLFYHEITRHNIANVFIPGFLWEYDKKSYQETYLSALCWIIKNHDLTRFFLCKKVRSVVGWSRKVHIYS